MPNHKQQLQDRAAALPSEAPRALSCVEYYNAQNLRRWRERWAEYHRQAPNTGVKQK